MSPDAPNLVDNEARSPWSSILTANAGLGLSATPGDTTIPGYACRGQRHLERTHCIGAARAAMVVGSDRRAPSVRGAAAQPHARPH